MTDGEFFSETGSSNLPLEIVQCCFTSTQTTRTIRDGTLEILNWRTPFNIDKQAPQEEKEVTQPPYWGLKGSHSAVISEHDWKSFIRHTHTHTHTDIYICVCVYVYISTDHGSVEYRFNQSPYTLTLSPPIHTLSRNVLLARPTRTARHRSVRHSVAVRHRSRRVWSRHLQMARTHDRVFPRCNSSH